MHSTFICNRIMGLLQLYCYLMHCAYLSTRWSNYPAICCLAERERRIKDCLPRIGISSCDELLGDRVLQVLVWIVGVICLLTNALVIWWRIREHKVDIIINIINIIIVILTTTVTIIIITTVTTIIIVIIVIITISST